MAPLGYDALVRSLSQGSIAPVYYLYGAEDILKNEIIQSIIDRTLDPGLRDFNLDQRSAGSLDPEAIDSLCYGLPMMSDRRVVVIRDVEAWKKKPKPRAAVVKYLAKPSADTVLILVQGAAEPDPDPDFGKAGCTVLLDPLDPERALQWIQAEAVRAGVTFGPGAAEHLVRAVGVDLGALRSELAKLEAFAAGDLVSVDRLGDLIGIRHGETLEDWRDAVLEGDTRRALTLTTPVLDQSGMSGVKMVTLLGGTLVFLGAIRARFDARARGRALESAGWDVLKTTRPAGLGNWKDLIPKVARWVPAWPETRILAAVRSALAADQALKSTTVSGEEELIRQLVLEMSPIGREVAA